MKNKKLVIIGIIVFVLFLIVLCLNLFVKKDNTSKNNIRYNEIKTSTKKAVDLVISAKYPSCTNEKEYNEDISANLSQHFFSDFLISNGYIKKSELLDVDNKSYCDVFIKIKTLYEDPYDHQKDCKIYYRVFLKCKDYEDKGYGDFENE